MRSPTWLRRSLFAICLMAGAVSVTGASAAGVASSGKINTFQLSGGLQGTLVMPSGAPCGLNALTGDITGAKGAKSWTMAITRTGSSKNAPSILVLIAKGVNGLPILKDEFVQAGGGLKLGPPIPGMNGLVDSASMNMSIQSASGGVKARLVGSYKCPTP